jgi:hypothetical protein
VGDDREALEKQSGVGELPLEEEGLNNSHSKRSSPLAPGGESNEKGTASRLRRLCGVGEVSRRRAGRWRWGGGGGVPVTGGCVQGGILLSTQWVHQIDVVGRNQCWCIREFPKATYMNPSCAFHHHGTNHFLTA